MEKIIEVSGLRKNYGDVQAVRGIDFYVEKGSLFAFLGPNGAGKSTTIDILCTFLRPDGGKVIINGFELGKEDAKIRSSIGVVFQDSMLDKSLTVYENLKVRGRFYNLSGAKLEEAIERAISSTGCGEFKNKRYDKLSGGQRRKADIARALINTPQILFLDEPTTGLDPNTRKEIWNFIKTLRETNGLTVFLTTHYMEEAAGADYVAIIDKGLISVKGTPFDIREKYSSDTVTISPTDINEFKAALQKDNTEFEEQAGLIKMNLTQTLDAIDIINKYKPMIKSFEVKSGTMDDAFIKIVGGGIS